jgi:hypothetical protein
MMAFIRRGDDRYPIRPVFGPNIAREIVKDESKAAFERMAPTILERIGHEIGRMLG